MPHYPWGNFIEMIINIAQILIQLQSDHGHKLLEVYYMLSCVYGCVKKNPAICYFTALLQYTTNAVE